MEADHRRHAEIENAIRDLNYDVGLNHLPSGRFAVNAAWLEVQVIAHNLARWTACIGLGEQIVTTKTLSGGSSPWPDGSPARHAASPCIFPSTGLGKPSAVAPWPGCEPFHSQPEGASVPEPPNGQPNVPANSRQSGPRVPLAASSPRYLALTDIRRRSQSLPAATEDRHRPPLLQSCPDHRLPLLLTAYSAVVTSSLRWIRVNGPMSLPFKYQTANNNCSA